jgi:soluble lytic murein transglycosylase
MRSTFCLLLLSFALPALGTPTQDADFLAAHKAYQKGDAVRLEQFVQRLKGTPLEVYADYYRLRLGMETAETGAIKAFLARTEDTPVIDRLRGEWLKHLGQKQEWAMFDAEYPRLIKEDTELTCYALQSRLRHQKLAALNEARNLWFDGRGQPDSCGPLFEEALSAGIIGERDIRLRLRLALEAGNVSLARQLAARLEGTIPPAVLHMAATDPGRYLEKAKLRDASEDMRTVALFALRRLASQSPDLAIARWNKMAMHFPEREQRYFYGWLAYEAARKLDDRATHWFKAAGDAPLNMEQSAWRVRAALRAQDWPAVLAGIAAMDARQQRETAWQYWRARALREAGKTDEARGIFARLGSEHDFYGQLAVEEISRSAISSKTGDYKPSEQDIADMLALPGIQRTLALYRMDLRSEAFREWSWAVRNFNDHELLTAAEIARRHQMYDRAIGAAELTVNVHDFGLRYLAPYRTALQSYLREHGLEEAWVYGLMRQESRFAASAKSSAGASGLMQLMPATARWVASRLGLKSYRHALIHEVDLNLKLGTYYLKTVLSWFDDNPVLATAAYNAGPGRARRWRGDQALEGAIYAESIPFDETRDYVKKVMSNTMHYAWQFDAAAFTLKQRMGTIAAKTPANQRAVPDER